MDNSILLSLICGIVIFALVLLLIKDDSKDPLLKQRLRNIKDRKTGDGTSKEKSLILEQYMEDSDYKIGSLSKILDKLDVIKKLKKGLRQADIKTSVDIFIIQALIIMFAVTLVLSLFIGILIAPIAGFIAGLLPFFVIKFKISKRSKNFTKQFPDCLGLLASSLRAGHSLLSAFQLVSNEMNPPVSQVFKQVSDDISLGKDTKDALEDMAQAIPTSQDLRFFVTAVMIQREIGGNLAEILDNLSHTIRERFKLLGLIESQTAQAKLSGIILGLAPAALGGIISMMNPKYMEPLFTTPLGWGALALAVTMSALGFFIINKITNIRV